jgi:hypothetical protein
MRGFGCVWGLGLGLGIKKLYIEITEGETGWWLFEFVRSLGKFFKCFLY